jgi:SagB-type dehydrogenase family enzyme
VNDWLAATPGGTERLPRDVAERVERVFEFHRSTKYTYQSMRSNPISLNWASQPSPDRVFPDLPKTPLPRSVVDAPVSMVPLLAEGLAAVPESQLQPPQNLKTLATWLYYADGASITARGPGGNKISLRTCPSSGTLYPFEIYIAAFGVDGLEPGLYHYGVRDFELRRMRDGLATLNHMKRGRPDLNFLNSVPAALLVSSIYCRSTWRYRQRGYRCALLDTGHLVQNLVAVANGLGIQTMPRFLINDNTMRELIGIPAEVEYRDAESVQAMVVWADTATKPMDVAAQPKPPAGPMPPIPRQPLGNNLAPYGSVLAVHHDCVAPGMPMREIRPPFTELTPVLEMKLDTTFGVVDQPHSGPTVRQVSISRRSTRQFSHAAITRDHFVLLNRLSFRGGSVLPLFPDGSHAALVRPFWIVNSVVGVEPGVWYYHPANDRWAMLRHGDFRTDAAYLSTEQAMAGDASAVCFMMANLQTLMTGAGPDTYRLAHLEAGLMGQRIYAAATALGIGCCGISTFYDDDVRSFCGLEQTGWEPIYEMAVGMAGTPPAA